MQTTLPLTDLLFVYGLPEPKLHLDLERWLEEGQRYVVVLEDDSVTLKKKTMTPERMFICDVTDEAKVKSLLWQLIFLTVDFLSVPGSQAKDEGIMGVHFAKIEKWYREIHLIASDYRERGIPHLRNYLANTPKFHRAREGKALFGKFKKIPAVICGAGSSLEKEIQTLKNVQEHSLLFAGGTAMSALQRCGITPHFGGIIDPQPPLKGSAKNFPYPTFFQSRANPKVLEKVTGPLLYVPGGENDFFENENFEGGWNVTTFLVSVAYHLGCDPIILVGVDLCRTKEKGYAGGLAVRDEITLIPLSNGLYTQTDWLSAGEWLGNFAKNHPDVEWINASSGLLLEGFKLQPIPQVKGEVLAGLQEVDRIKIGVKPPVSPDELKKSFTRAGKLCDQMLLLLERLFPQLPDKKGEYILLEAEMGGELAYQRFLLPLWNVWKHVFVRQIPQEIPHAFGVGLNQWLFMKGVCDDARKI